MVRNITLLAVIRKPIQYWALVMYSGDVNFVALFIQLKRYQAGLGVLWKPRAGLGHLGRQGKVRLGYSRIK